MQSTMDLPSFDVLETVFDDDDDFVVQQDEEDPFAPLPIDQPMEDSLLTSSIATLLTSFDIPASTETTNTNSNASFVRQAEQMSEYVKSLSKIGKKTKSSRHSKKKKALKKKMAAAAGVPVPASPRTAQQLFAQHVRTQLEACGIAKVEWEEIIARRWRSIDEPTRTYFGEFAAREMSFYKNAMAQYKKVCRTVLRSNKAASRKNKASSTTTTSLCNNNLAVPKTTMTASISSSSDLKKNPTNYTWILPKPPVITPTSSCNELVNNKPTVPSQDLDMTASLLLEPTPLPLPNVVLPINDSRQDLLVHNNNFAEYNSLKTRGAPSMAALAQKLGSDSTQALIQIFAQEMSWERRAQNDPFF